MRSLIDQLRALALEGKASRLELETVVKLYLDIRYNLGAVTIVSVGANSAAARAGLRPGDIIASVNRQKCVSDNDFARVFNESNGTVDIMYARRQIDPGGSIRYDTRVAKVTLDRTN